MPRHDLSNFISWAASLTPSAGARLGEAVRHSLLTFAKPNCAAHPFLQGPAIRVRHSIQGVQHGVLIIIPVTVALAVVSRCLGGGMVSSVDVDVHCCRIAAITLARTFTFAVAGAFRRAGAITRGASGNTSCHDTLVSGIQYIEINHGCFSFLCPSKRSSSYSIEVSNGPRSASLAIHDLDQALRVGAGRGMANGDS